MIFASDSHDLGWLALGIRPIPAFGHGGAREKSSSGGEQY